MRKYILLFLLLIPTAVFADSSVIERVYLEPLSSGISFNTVDLHSPGVNKYSWVTCPSVEMRGRKEMVIVDNSANDVYLTDISGSTVKGTLKAGNNVTFKASSSLHIYVSASSVTQIEAWEIR